MKKPINILTIGGATQDLFLKYPTLDTVTLPNDNQKNYIVLEEGAKIDLKELNYYSGGGSTNSAVSFKKLGFNVSSFFKLGNDAQADFILNDLKKENIDISHVVYSDSLPTAVSIIFPCPSGDRVVLAYRGANKDLNIQDVPFDLMKQQDAIYITSLSGKSSELLFEICKFAKSHNILVAANPGKNQFAHIENFKNCLTHIDILTLNNLEAQELLKVLKPAQNYNIKDYFKEILSHGPKIVAVTDGANGVHVIENNTIYFHPSIKPAKIVNTLGAGDAFGSCFVASILHGKAIEEALLLGLLNSVSVISKEGAKTGLLTMQELEEKIKTVQTELPKAKL